MCIRDSNYTMPQADQDRFATRPLWTPVYASPASASNSAYYYSHATSETARVVFEHGLWPAAVAIWSQGTGGGQKAPYVVRREDARWVNGMLTANGMQPLSLQALAQKAHAMQLVTGAVGHTFNRWQWAEADFDILGTSARRPLDALAVRLGSAPDAGAVTPAPDTTDTPQAATPVEASLTARRSAAGYRMIARRNLFYPPMQRNNAGVTYYSANAALVELAVDTGTGAVELLAHHSIMECGRPIVPELVHGQLEGGIAMGIGHALYETCLLYTSPSPRDLSTSRMPSSA